MTTDLEIVCCPVCFREYCQRGNEDSAPCVLFCGHTFCKKCVTQLGQTFSSQCALCRVSFGNQPATRNFQLEDTISMIRSFLREETSIKEELEDLRRVHSAELENVKRLEESTTLMQLQLKTFEKERDATDFDSKMLQIIERNVLNETPIYDKIHSEARQWIEATAEQHAEQKRKLTEMMTGVRKDYIRKFKDTRFFDSQVGYVKMDRPLQKRVLPYLTRMSYKQLLMYTSLGQMDGEQTSRFNTFLTSLAETIRTQTVCTQSSNVNVK